MTPHSLLWRHHWVWLNNTRQVPRHFPFRSVVRSSTLRACSRFMNGDFQESEESLLGVYINSQWKSLAMAETLVSMVTGPPRGRKDTLRQNHSVAEADSCLELWDQSRFHCRSCDRRQRWDRIHQCRLETQHFPYLFQTFVVMVTVINTVSGLRAGLPTCVAMVTLITVMAWMKRGAQPLVGLMVSEPLEWPLESRNSKHQLFDETLRVHWEVEGQQSAN